mmetsp:Transcript_14594/g.25681  ORF Transcript_14594/g.25681 Transcript_14594/m.25681 type:complete len:290 (-) Transcript_14594:67-936(-)
MDLLTLANYTFVTVTSLIQTGTSIIFERKIPLTNHLATAAVAVARNLLDNCALSMGLPMLVVLVVKNAGLLVSVLVSFVVLRVRFSFMQVFAALVVSLGIMKTLTSRPSSRKQTESATLGIDNFVYAVMLLIAGLVAQQLQDILDDYAFRTYGKHKTERMFYKVALGLPVLLWDGRSLFNQGCSWATEKTEDVFGIGQAIPVLWVLLFVNMLINYLVKLSATEVVATSSAVILRLTMTVQRAVSTILTAYLNTPPWPELGMWFGIAHVFGGAIAFTIAPKVPDKAKKVE